jgi:regulator of chromosome condensation
VLAVNDRGKVFAWGAGEQNQLARRVISRTALGALIPREFGLQRKFITKIGCGDYHCFAVDNKGNTYGWGLNTFGETGIPKDQDDENSTINRPTLIDSLQGHQIKQIAGGAHHSLACTEDGQLLIWGRVDTAQGGMGLSKFPKGDLFYDEHDKPRFLLRPAVIPSKFSYSSTKLLADSSPDINGNYVSAASDTCLAIDIEGRAYSWGFSANYQTGQGQTDDVTEATLIDNTAVRGKRLVFAGAGGQFGVLGAVHEDTEMTNGA